ncbi:MAG: hypothetical protein ACFB2W_21705 [Leptolyngbyaceae cyanobacterium]
MTCNFFKTTAFSRTIAVVLLAVAPTACVRAFPEVASATSKETAQSEFPSDVEKNLSETVSIRGEVREKIEEISFLLEDERVLGGEDILVITPDEPVVLIDGYESDLQVTGELKLLVISDFEQQYGIELTPELYSQYENSPVVVAQSIALAPGPEDLTRHPEVYYTHQIAVSGEVEEIFSSTAFVLDEEQVWGGEDLLVLSRQPVPQVKTDSNVIATGVLRPYNKADFERDYGTNWETSIQQMLGSDYADQPVFVADEVDLLAP